MFTPNPLAVGTFTKTKKKLKSEKNQSNKPNQISVLEGQFAENSFVFAVLVERISPSKLQLPISNLLLLS